MNVESQGYVKNQLWVVAVPRDFAYKFGVESGATIHI